MNPSHAERTAFHEAGHAVVYALHGLEFDFVTVKNSAEEAVIDGKPHMIVFCGLRDSDEHSVVRAARRQAGDEREFLGSMAGAAAEARLIGEIDDEVLKGLVLDTPHVPKGRRNEFAAKADELVSGMWPTVERVAQELLSQKTLTYQQVLDLIEPK